MKKLLIPIMIAAIFVAFYEQNIPKPNVFITIISVAVFMFGMMKLSSKIPNKKDQDDSTEI